MYRRLFFLILLALPAFTGTAQLSISVQEPLAGLVQKKQLWNLALIYSGNDVIEVTVGLTLVDQTDNQPVLTAYTRPISLSKGVKRLKAADVEPVDYQFISAAFNRVTDALLPIGNYQACYSVYVIAHEGRAVLAENCIGLEVQPLSPPQLTMPYDSATVQNPWPQFGWLPPAPVTLFNDLNYDLLLTEVRADQSPATAIQENMPVYNAHRLTTMVNNYPSSSRRLDTGKVYAWRIIAKNGENFAAQSDVWTFTISNNQQGKSAAVPVAYMDLKKGSSYTATAVLPGNVLGIRYYSYDEAHETTVRFLNEKGEMVREMKRSIEYGNNLMVFTLDHSFKKDITYFIEVTDLQMSSYKASFRLSN